MLSVSSILSKSVSEKSVSSSDSDADDADEGVEGPKGSETDKRLVEGELKIEDIVIRLVGFKVSLCFVGRRYHSSGTQRVYEVHGVSMEEEWSVSSSGRQIRYIRGADLV
jgi:hypothetical protein